MADIIVTTENISRSYRIVGNVSFSLPLYMCTEYCKFINKYEKIRKTGIDSNEGDYLAAIEELKARAKDMYSCDAIIGLNITYYVEEDMNGKHPYLMYYGTVVKYE